MRFPEAASMPVAAACRAHRQRGLAGARSWPLAMAVAACVAASGCAPGGLEFRNDHRLSFLTPRENQLVSVPLVVRWTMSDFTVAGPHQAPVGSHTGYFALFVDRTPIRPGQTLAAVNSDDPSCRDTKLCLMPSYLAHEGVYTATEPMVRLAQIADLSNHESVQYHTATVVLMSTAGERINESAWNLEFKMRASDGT
jgi:hypothetical protein